ncbi:MAG: heavy-metal-associated domain-containing protein [Bacteroidales bacterium]|nr:heavy-metal-associated domain-containing protein [Bacteroidales bacterium]
MKKFLLALAVAAAAVMLLTSAKPKDKSREALFQTNLHCKNCAAKIQDNVSFEKGVKDLSINVDAKTVRIVYNPAKTDAGKLAEAIRKLGYTAELIEDKSL